MNQINKIKLIFNRNNFLLNSYKFGRSNFKNVIVTHQRSIILASSFVSLTFIGYKYFSQHSTVLIHDSSCESMIFSTNSQIKTEWINKPESVRIQEKIMAEEAAKNLSKEAVDDILDHVHKPETSIIKPKSEGDTGSILPTEVPYLIIGGGIAGMSAARAIRASDPFAKVLIINSECQSPGEHNEAYPPYRRILLSKFIWRRTPEHQKTLLDVGGDVKNSSLLFLEPETFFVPPENLNQTENGGISLLNNTRVVSIDPRECSVTLDGSGHTIFFKACLIATGSSPRRLKHLEVSNNTDKDLYNDGKVSYFRSLNDFRNLYEKIQLLREKENGGRILILGSGLLGTELTASLGRLAKDQGKLEIIEVFKEKTHLYHLLPEDLSNYIQKNILKTNVKVISQSEVVSISEMTTIGPDSGRLNVNIKPLVQDDQKQELRTEMVDHVVIAAGVKAETTFAHNGNLETDQMLGGYLVNAELQAREGIWVAGDACSFYDPLLGRRRVEHWDHAEESGTIAGHNMASFVLKTEGVEKLKQIDMSRLANNILKPKIYNFQSSFSFRLSMFKTFEALGLIDSTLETRTFIVQDFFDDLELDENSETGKEKQALKSVKKHDPLDMPGVVFFLRSKRIVGILLWNCDDDILIDSDFPSPLRSNVSRKILADRRLISSDEDLKALAADFDLSFFVNSQIKFLDEYTKMKKEKETEIAK